MWKLASKRADGTTAHSLADLLSDAGLFDHTMDTSPTGPGRSTTSPPDTDL
jgi:hypothetical protein